MPAALGIGLIGMGAVGGAVAQQLLADDRRLAARAGRPLELRSVVVRDLRRGRERLAQPSLVSDDVESVLAEPGVDIVIEVAGGMHPARDWITRALADGRQVVTANKLVMAAHGQELLALADGRLRFEAAVMAGVPVIGALVDGMAGQRVERIDAVLNGTSNAILEAMRAGGTFDEAVTDAQRRGYSEADPSADVDGHDAAAKLAIVVSLAAGAWLHPEAVLTSGIRSLRPADLRAARLTNHVVRLLGTARHGRGGWRVRVEPTALARDGADPGGGGTATRGHPLAELPGVTNGALLDGHLSGPVLLRGAGAGGTATAAAIISDLIGLARGRPGPAGPSGSVPLDTAAEETAALLAVEMTGDRDDLETIRLLLDDRGLVTARQSWDPGPLEAGLVHAGLVTAPAPRSTLLAALDTLDSDPRFESAVSWLPVAASTW